MNDRLHSLLSMLNLCNIAFIYVQFQLKPFLDTFTLIDVIKYVYYYAWNRVVFGLVNTRVKYHFTFNASNVTFHKLLTLKFTGDQLDQKHITCLYIFYLFFKWCVYFNRKIYNWFKDRVGNMAMIRFLWHISDKMQIIRLW